MGQRLARSPKTPLLFGHSVQNPRVHIVASDPLTGGMIAFERIWNRGYRRIAFVATRGSSIKTARFSAGFLQGQLKVDARRKLAPLLLDELDYRKDEKRFLSWLRKTRPDAIFTGFDDACPGVLKCAYGDKVAYSSWGDYFLMEALDRELHQNPAGR